MNYIKNMIDTRKDHDQTQAELAKAIGWSRIQIARYETGINTPSVDYLIAFCEYYKISADYLLELSKDCKNPRR